jgi:DNA-binding NarL/FixJ family response regulator
VYGSGQVIRRIVTDSTEPYSVVRGLTLYNIRNDKAKNLNHVKITKEKSGILSTKSDQLEWRRSKVVELRSRGLSYAEIAHELQVSKASITSDVQFLRPHI